RELRHGCARWEHRTCSRVLTIAWRAGECRRGADAGRRNGRHADGGRTRMKPLASPRVGAVRPSQLMFSHGVGALIDLPNFSAVVLGLDEWDATHQQT